MSKLDQFRAQFDGAYDDMEDGTLAFKLWNAKYKSQMSMGELADLMELDNNQFNAMIQAARQSGYEPTSEVSSQPQSPIGYGGDVGGFARAGLQGLTFGAGDEIVAGMTSAARKLGGDYRDIGDIFSQEQKLESQRLEEFRSDRPTASMATEFGSSMLTPMGVARNAKQALGLGAGTGAFSGFASSEGDLSDRFEAGTGGAILGGLLGPAFYKGGELATSEFGSFFRKRAQKAASEGAPSLEALRREAKQAYDAAGSQGARIDKATFDKFVESTIRSVTDGKSQMGPARQALMPATSRVVGEMERLRDEITGAIDFDDLMEVRDLAGIAAGKVAERAESRGGMIVKNAIDDFVESLSPEQLSSVNGEEIAGLLKAARSAYRKMRTTEGIEMIQEKSGSYAGGLESGIKNQINSILRNDRKRKQYTPQEIEVMRQITEGTPLGNLLGNISSMGLSSTGGRNPFGPSAGMLVGGAGGYAVGGPEGAVAGAILEMTATSALKFLREKSMEEQVQIFRDLVASGAINQLQDKSPQVVRYLNAVAQRLGQGTIVSTSDKISGSSAQ